MSDIKITLNSDNRHAKKEMVDLVFGLLGTCLDYSMPAVAAEIDGEVIFRRPDFQPKVDLIKKREVTI